MCRYCCKTISASELAARITLFHCLISKFNLLAEFLRSASDYAEAKGSDALFHVRQPHHFDNLVMQESGQLAPLAW
jgi:hypothetical protein